MAAVAGAGGGGSGGGSGDSSRHNLGSRPAPGDSRKRNSFVAGLENSPGSVDSADLDGTENGQQHDEERRHPVKRACNECRQQKVSPLHQEVPLLTFLTDEFLSSPDNVGA